MGFGFEAGALSSSSDEIMVTSSGVCVGGVCGVRSVRRRTEGTGLEVEEEVGFCWDLEPVAWDWLDGARDEKGALFEPGVHVVDDLCGTRDGATGRAAEGGFRELGVGLSLACDEACWPPAIPVSVAEALRLGAANDPEVRIRLELSSSFEVSEGLGRRFLTSISGAGSKTGGEMHWRHNIQRRVRQSIFTSKLFYTNDRRLL